MITNVLRELTDTCWILERDGTKVGLVSATPAGLKYIGVAQRQTFATADDLGTFLGGSVSIEGRDEDESGDEIGNVEGYPIKHKAAFDISTADIVTYAKTAKGKARFAAGYFGLEFDHGWTASYCPRSQTLADYNYIGPFRTRLEMLNAIAAKKRSQGKDV